MTLPWGIIIILHNKRWICYKNRRYLTRCWTSYTRVMVRGDPLLDLDTMYKRHPYPRCKFGSNDKVVNATYVKCTTKPRKVGSFEARTQMKNETCVMCDDAPKSQDDQIVPFSVTVTGDFKDSQNNFGYRYYKDPDIWQIYPHYGPKNGQTYVQVWGANFLNFDQNLRCGFGTKEVPAYFVSQNYMYCYSPQSDVVLKRMPFSITLNNQQNTQREVPYWYYPMPSISRLIPDRGPDQGGTRVMLKGNHYDPFVDKRNEEDAGNLNSDNPDTENLSVIDKVMPFDNRNDTFCRFGELGLVQTTVLNATKAICHSPPSYILRWVYVEITLNNQQYTDDFNKFHYYHPPFVYDINPRRGPVAGNTTVYVTGSHFKDTGDIHCKFNQTIVDGYYIDSNTLKCISPKYPRPEKVPLSVSLQGDKFSSGINTAYTYYDTPIVYSIDPICGPQRGYTQITVHGKNFQQNFDIVKCVFNETRYMNATVMNNSTLVCDSPPVIDEYGYNPEGIDRYDLQIEFSGNGLSGNKQRFNYYREVEMNKIVPHGGPIEGGTFVKIEGQGFKHWAGCNRTVRFATFQTKPINFTEKYMYVKAPNVTIPDDVVVGVAMNGQQFVHDKKVNCKSSENTYTYYSRPVVTHYKPKIGHSKGGTTQTIWGRGFTPYRDENGRTVREPMYVRFLEKPLKKNQKPTKIISGNFSRSFEIDEDYMKWKTPPAKAGTKAILEISLNGQEWTQVIPKDEAYSFTYYDAASVSFLQPSYGPVHSQQQMTTIVHGERFNCPQNDCSKITAEWTDQDHDNAKIYTKCEYIDTQQLKCDVPKYNTPNVLKVEVSMDGEDYTSDGREFGFFDPYILRVDPKLVTTKGNTTIRIKGYGFVNVSSDQIRVRYGSHDRPLVCGENKEECVKHARYINKNQIETETFPQKQVQYSNGDGNVQFDEFAVQVSLFEADYTRNNITIMYYEQGEYSKVQPDWAPNNEPTPLLTKSNLKFKPDDGKNDPERFEKWGNFSCKYEAPDGREVVTKGRMLIYPYQGENCTASTTIQGSDGNPTTITDQKKCPTRENAIHCKSPDNWQLPEDVEKEVVKMKIAINGVDYSQGIRFKITQGVEVDRIVPRCGPRKGGSETKIIGKGFTQQDSIVNVKWGVLTTKQMKKKQVSQYIYSKQSYTTTSDSKAKSYATIDKIAQSQLMTINACEKDLKKGATYKYYSTLSPKLPDYLQTHGGPVYVSIGRTLPLKWQNTTSFDYHAYSRSFFEYFYYIQPVVKQVWPTGGTVKGGSVLVIQGSWFKYRPEYGLVPYCKFGDTKVRGVWESTVRILCASPPTEKGNSQVNLEVSQNAVSWVDSGKKFSYFQIPILHDIKPKSGPENGGTSISVIGEKFSRFFNQTQFFCRFSAIGSKIPPKQIPAIFVNETCVQCRSPGGWGSGTLAKIQITYNQIEYYEVPSYFYFYNIIGAFPRSGPSDGTGGFIHIRGQAFRQQDPISCNIDQQRYHPISVMSTEIKCPMPKASQGPKFFGNVPLKISINGINEHSFVGGFQYYEQPIIKSINPLTGPAQGKGLINLYGDNFRDDYPLVDLSCRVGNSYGKAIVKSSEWMTCIVEDIRISGTNLTLHASIALNNYSFTKPNMKTQYQAYAIRYIQPNSGPINSKTPVIVHGAGFFNTKQSKCRFGVDGNYATVKGTVLSAEKMLCRAPGKFKFDKGSGLPHGVPFSIALNQEKYNPWTESHHSYLLYTQPKLKKLIPNFAKVGDIKEVFIYAKDGSEFWEPPPTSTMPSKYSLTCKFGKFGRTPAILINATLVKCMTPTYTDNPNKIYRETEKFQLALNGEDYTQKNDKLTFTFIGTGSYPYWWYILLFILIALLLFLLVICIQICWRMKRPQFPDTNLPKRDHQTGPHVIRDHTGLARPKGMPDALGQQLKPGMRGSMRPSQMRLSAMGTSLRIN